jgi:hypothetical protein
MTASSCRHALNPSISNQFSARSFVMAARQAKQRFIPFRKREIVNMALEDGGLGSEEEKEDFRKFCKMVESVFHFEFHEVLERLKDNYFPMNPDLTKRCATSKESLDFSAKKVFEDLKEVLNDANYEEIQQEDIDEAFGANAVLSINVQIDKEDFSEVYFYSRGARREKIETSKWFGFKKVVNEHDILERVCMFVRFKPKEYYTEKKLRDLPYEPGTTMIKLFKDVPKEDLEILFPNCKASMTTKDALILGVPALVGGIALMATKVLPALIVIALLAATYFGYKGTVEENTLKKAVAAMSALVAIGGFALKQWMKYKNMKYQFQKELSDNLYFRNLVNNAGVFHALIDEAEEEECKEAFLAYYFLYTSDTDLTEEELDKRIEQWFLNKFGCSLDFECPDALSKLERLRLLRKDERGALKVYDLKESLRILDEDWDNIFQYNKADPES